MNGFALAIVFFLVTNRSLPSEAWVSPAALSLASKHAATAFGSHSKPTVLFYSSEFDFDQSNSNSTDTKPPTSVVVERLRVNGVSVSPKGFHVLLESTTGRRRGPENDENETPLSTTTKTTTKEEEPNEKIGSVLPLKMTNDPADAYAATSPESLTLCQLLSGVDMAGAILPPELLGRIVVCHVEDKLDSLYDEDDTENDGSAFFVPALSPVEGKIWEYLRNQEALLREQNLYGPKPPPQKDSSKPLSFSSNIPMPQVTLDQLTLLPSSSSSSSENGDDSDALTWLCQLECALPEWKERIVVDVRADLLASLAYNYDPEASPLFTCIALALRYKAPIVLKEEPQRARFHDHHDDHRSGKKEEAAAKESSYWSSPDDLNRDFPQRKTLVSLHEQSTRLTQNIERGFEIHKLTGALQIAIKLGDTEAAEKIRAKLDECDSMEDLPTLEASENDTPSGDRRLDDLENNILQ